MQRRTTQRSSTHNDSLPYRSPPILNRDNDKNKSKTRSFNSLLRYAITTTFALVCIYVFLTPSQKNELIEAENRVEDWVQHRHPPAQQEKEPQTVEKVDIATPKEIEAKVAIQEAPKQEEEPRHHSHDNPPHNEKANSGSSEAAMISKPSRWVDAEKELKKKLKVLYDRQAEGQNLGVPVLTRYLGEDIPAFVGTPDSTMKEEEWKKLVEDKYREMRVEEEQWQKKMALLIEKRERDIGITTP